MRNAILPGDPRLVDSIHASILADARPTGYSYVLSQAHQHATIFYELASVLHTAARACYLAETGQIPYLSAKNRMKRSIRSRR